jgi:hypothetical protein
VIDDLIDDLIDDVVAPVSFGVAVIPTEFADRLAKAR